MSTLKRKVPPFSSGSGTEWGFSDCYIDEVGGPKDPCAACSELELADPKSLEHMYRGCCWCTSTVDKVINLFLQKNKSSPGYFQLKTEEGGHPLSESIGKGGLLGRWQSGVSSLLLVWDYVALTAWTHGVSHVLWYYDCILNPRNFHRAAGRGATSNHRAKPVCVGARLVFGHH